VNRHVLKKIKHFALPNVWASRHVVPELVGLISPAEAAEKAQAMLEDSSVLSAMREDLGRVSQAQSQGGTDPAALVASKCLELAAAGTSATGDQGSKAGSPWPRTPQTP